MPKGLNEVPTQSYLPAKIRSQKEVKVPHLQKIYCFVTKQPAGWHLETCLRFKNTLLLQHVTFHLRTGELRFLSGKIRLRKCSSILLKMRFSITLMMNCEATRGCIISVPLNTN